MTTRQQIHEALESYLDAHTKAQEAAAAWFDLKRTVGGNETERKIAKSTMPDNEYIAYLEQFNAAEKQKIETAAAAERAEKILNTLRELLESETADVNRATAELTVRVADRYADLSLAPPARPIVMRPIDTEPPF